MLLFSAAPFAREVLPFPNADKSAENISHLTASFLRRINQRISQIKQTGNENKPKIKSPAPTDPSIETPVAILLMIPNSARPKLKENQQKKAYLLSFAFAGTLDSPFLLPSCFFSCSLRSRSCSSNSVSPIALA